MCLGNVQIRVYGTYVRDMMLNIKHQSVRLLVTMFGLLGCDPPMDTCFPKGAGCLRLIVRKYIVYKYPWQRVFSNLFVDTCWRSSVKETWGGGAKLYSPVLEVGA